jgi:DNA-binding NarL/FixJ family response regulator
MQSVSKERKPLGLLWIVCSYPVVAEGLARILEGEAQVYRSRKAPVESPSSVVLCIGSVEGLSENIKHIKSMYPEASILIFGLYQDLALARSALRLGARGFIHAGMKPSQIVRAIEVAANGEIVAPRQLMEYLIAYEDPVDLDSLSTRQREILGFVVEGLSNAQIAKRLYLSESTVKQHLRAAYKLLGVSNRTEAAKLIRNAS